MDIIPRSAWLGGLSFSGPGYDKSLVHTVVYHFPGTTWTKVPSLEAALQSAHRYYLSNRGYSLGYGYGIDGGGRIAEIRGTQYRNAANVGTRAKTNTSNFNPFSIAQWFLVNIRDRATSAALDAAARNHVRLEQFHGRQLWVKGHRDVGDTTCPGAVYAQLDELRSRIVEVRKPKPAPVPPPPAGDGRTLMPHGWYRMTTPPQWPWSIALAVWGDGRLHTRLIEDNGWQAWENGQPFIEIRDTPTVVTDVRSGEGAFAVIRRALNVSGDVSDRLGPFWTFNGGEHTLKVNEVVSVPVFWSEPT